MRAALALAAFVLLGADPCSAQTSRQYDRCSQKADTTREFIDCAAAEFHRADALLNNVYRALLAKKASDTRATEKIKAAERAWMAYRDAYVDAMFPEEDSTGEYGSWWPVQAYLLRAELTQAHVTELRALIMGGHCTSGALGSDNPDEATECKSPV